MNKTTHFSGLYDRLTVLVLCIITLVTLPMIFFIPSNDILTSMAKTNVMQKLNMPLKTTILSLELFVSCFALFLCWSIVEVQRQRSNKIFEKLLKVASDAERCYAQHDKEDIILRKSINLLEQTMEDYALLLFMMHKNRRDLNDINSVKPYISQEKGLDEDPFCLAYCCAECACYPSILTAFAFLQTLRPWNLLQQNHYHDRSA